MSSKSKKPRCFYETTDPLLNCYQRKDGSYGKTN